MGGPHDETVFQPKWGPISRPMKPRRSQSHIPNCASCSNSFAADTQWKIPGEEHFGKANSVERCVRGYSIASMWLNLTRRHIRMSVVWRWEQLGARWTCILRGRASSCIGFFACDTCMFMVIRLPCTYWGGTFKSLQNHNIFRSLNWIQWAPPCPQCQSWLNINVKNRTRRCAINLRGLSFPQHPTLKFRGQGDTHRAKMTSKASNSTTNTVYTCWVASFLWDTWTCHSLSNIEVCPKASRNIQGRPQLRLQKSYSGRYWNTRRFWQHGSLKLCLSHTMCWRFSVKTFQTMFLPWCTLKSEFSSQENLCLQSLGSQGSLHLYDCRTRTSHWHQQTS